MKDFILNTLVKESHTKKVTKKDEGTGIQRIRREALQVLERAIERIEGIMAGAFPE